MAKNLLLIILAGLFLGCSHTAGSKYDIKAIDRIAVGQTTEGDVVAMLGPPLSEKKLNNSLKLCSYAYGDRCPVGFGTAVDSMQVQFYNGVAVYKWQSLMQN